MRCSLRVNERRESPRARGASTRRERKKEKKNVEVERSDRCVVGEERGCLHEAPSARNHRGDLQGPRVSGTTGVIYRNYRGDLQGPRVW